MSYIIIKTASKNPDIAGCTLYLRGACWWALFPGSARKFKTKREAKEWFKDWNQSPDGRKIEKLT